MTAWDHYGLLFPAMRKNALVLVVLTGCCSVDGDLGLIRRRSFELSSGGGGGSGTSTTVVITDFCLPLEQAAARCARPALPAAENYGNYTCDMDRRRIT
jgi:hypothetical protein